MEDLVNGRRTIALLRNHAAVAMDHGVRFVDIERADRSIEVELENVIDVTVVGDGFWVAAGSPPMLHRFGARGAAAGSPSALPGGTGMLHATAVGAPGALWTASPPTMIAASGAATPIADDDAFILPVSTGRWLACRRDRVELRDASSVRWRNTTLGGGKVIDGAILFDGRTAALLIARDGAPLLLVVLHLHDGSVQHRATLTGIELVRFAPARGYMLMRSGTRTLILFDLRFGRVVQEYTDANDILDAALDPSGQTYALRHGHRPNELAFAPVRDLLAARTAPAPVDEPVAEAPIVAEPPAPLPAEPAVNDEFHRGHAKLALSGGLAPRAERARITAEQAVAWLEHYRPLAAALVARAIALAWDSGRITFSTDSHLPFHSEVVGILGRMKGRASEELAAAESALRTATDALRAADANLAPRLSPLALLAAELGLSEVARSALMLIAAPALWGELARLYGILGNDEHRPIIDEQLLIQILDGTYARDAIARELDRDSPLIRYGLVRLGKGQMRPFVELTCEPIVLRILKGSDPARELDDVRLVPASCGFDDLLIPAAAKTAIVGELATVATRARLVVRGRTGSGRHTLLAAIAAAGHRTLGIIDAAATIRDGRGRAGLLRDALLRAHMLGLLPCVDGLEAIASDDHATRDAIAAVLDEHPGPLAVRLPWTTQPPLRPGYVSLELPSLTPSQRDRCWTTLLQKYQLTVRSREELVEHFAIGPGIIDRVCQRVAAMPAATTEDGPVDRALQLEHAIRQHLEVRLQATSTRVTNLASWSRVVLPPDIQDSVLELISRIKHRRTIYDRWGFDRVITTARGVTALFQGGPGTGKTLVASAIANELGMDLYRVDLSRIMSKWVGETEQNLARLFDAAEDGHAIILFDEADSLFSKRTEVRTSVDRYANLEVNYLLQRLDSFEGIAILTTNFGTAIDSAFKRRLSFRLTFPFPDEEAREALWRAHMPPELPRHGDLDLASLARRFQLSGGYIRNATLRAAFLAAGEQTPLTQDHLERAIRAEFREIGKIGDAGVLE